MDGREISLRKRLEGLEDKLKHIEYLSIAIINFSRHVIKAFKSIKRYKTKIELVVFIFGYSFRSKDLNLLNETILDNPGLFDNLNISLKVRKEHKLYQILDIFSKYKITVMCHENHWYINEFHSYP